jgi:hypothetical protein
MVREERRKWMMGVLYVLLIEKGKGFGLRAR